MVHNESAAHGPRCALDDQVDSFRMFAKPRASKAQRRSSRRREMCHTHVAVQHEPDTQNRVDLLRLEKDKKGGFENRACESCHGPGSTHVENATAAGIRN